MKNNGATHKEQDRRLESLETKVDQIQANELMHIKETLSSHSADLSWIKKIVFIAATSSVGAFINSIFATFK